MDEKLKLISKVLELPPEEQKLVSMIIFGMEIGKFIRNEQKKPIKAK